MEERRGYPKIIVPIVASIVNGGAWGLRIMIVQLFETVKKNAMRFRLRQAEDDAFYCRSRNSLLSRLMSASQRPSVMSVVASVGFVDQLIVPYDAGQDTKDQ